MSSEDSPVPAVPFETYTPRVAIVTGGTQGIGVAIVQRLAADGIDIAVNDIAANQEKIEKVVAEVREKGRRAIAVPGDVSIEADVIAIIEKTANELGSVDILVANAGIFPMVPFLELNIETFDQVLAVNTRGVALTFKYAALQMIKQGSGGRLIAASSMAGKQGQQNLVHYSASKFAVRGIVQASSLELRKYGITVNAYAPGPTITPEIAQQSGFATPDGMIKKVGSYEGQPLGKTENLASVVSYLVKPESYFITGQTIGVNGGAQFD